MVKAADTRVFESDNNFKFKVLEHEHDTECKECNAENTLKLKEVVVSARQQFKWQSTGADATLEENPFAEWLAPRTRALRPLYWEINSDAHTGFKMRHEGQHSKACFGVRRCESCCQA